MSEAESDEAAGREDFAANRSGKMFQQAENGPLAGLKVIEIGVAMAGPFCGMQLADYGANVIKVERIGEGDDSRRWAPFFAGGLSYYFAAANRNKRSLEIDLKKPEGVDALRRILSTADIVIDNFRVGALDKLGLGYEDLRKINQRLIYCSISGFGPTGPRAKQPANDIFMQGFAGSMSVTGEEGRGPVKSGISVADIGGAMFGLMGILLALEARHRTGMGQRVDTSLLEGQVAMMSYHLTYFFATGRSPVRRGSSMQFSVAYRAFQTSDDWVIVAAFNEKMWRGVCRGIERTDLLDDPRYKTSAMRAKERDVLVPLLRECFLTRTADEWIALLTAEDVPCTKINNVEQMVRDEQVQERDMIVELEHPLSGKIRMAGLPVKLSETPGSLRSAAPVLGIHSEEILLEEGFNLEDIRRLRQNGVLAPAKSLIGSTTGVR